MRARSALSVTLTVTLSLCVSTLMIGCGKITPPNKTDAPPTPGVTGTSVKADPNPDVGLELCKLRGPVVFPPMPLAGTEPTVIANSIVQYEDRQQVSSEVEGKIELIASPLTLRDGRFEWKQTDGPVIVYDPARPHPSIVFHPRDKDKRTPYWKLSESDTVEAGQIICMLDDQLVASKKITAERIKITSYEVQKHAKTGVTTTEDKIKLYKDQPDLISPKDRLEDLTQLSRFLENLAQANQSIAKAEQDVAEADLMIGKHQISSRVNGIIRNIAKRPGEFVRTGEKIFEIQSTEKVRLEGNLDVQYANRVRKGMMVTIEPAVPSAPIVSHTGHRQEVGGVAVTGHPGRPLIISAGLDGSALVWDPNLHNDKNHLSFTHNLPHSVPVRAVACTPLGLQTQLAVTGADDGKIRIWDVTDPAKLPSEPLHEAKDLHQSAVTAIAISPDGKFAASACGREVFIWELATGKKLYALPQDHRDSVTSVSFTPQSQLVTAAKDRTLKVWKLGTEKAALTRSVEHRSGVVDTLGVTPDGGRMLFDQGKDRIDLVNISDGQTAGQLTNVGPNVAFATLAVFGPDRSGPDVPAEKLLPYTIVTVGGEGDLKGGLQVWHAPRAGGRSAEIARLITPGRVPVTCAAFSPGKDSTFLVAGTADGKLHIWTPPSEPTKQLEGRVTYVDPTDPRYVTVRVEMINPKDVPLLDHSTATVIVQPEQK